MHKKQIRQLWNKRSRGQGMVEFAIALPVVLLIVFGTIELGFLLFSYSSVNSAAREAARYGIAIGDVGADQRYYDCDGIVAAGLKIGRFAGMTASDIAIDYDDGPPVDDGDPNTNDRHVLYSSCEALATANGGNITFGDRIVVTVNHQYKPLISYMGLNIAPFTMTSTSSRTIFKDAEIIPGGGDEGGGGGGGGGGETCYELMVNTVGQGTVAKDPAPNCPDPTTPSYYASGTTVTLTATPDSGWYTFSWIGGVTITGDNNIAEITMNANANVTVNFTSVLVSCYSLGTFSHDPNEGGANPVVTNASVSCGEGKFTDGETVTVSAAPNTGYMTIGWDGATSTGTDTASFTMPASDGHQVVAYYTAMDCYHVYPQVGGDPTGGGQPSVLSESAVCGADEFMAGEPVTLQAYPGEGYDVDYWDGAYANPLNKDQASLTMPEGDAAVYVYYTEEPILDPPSNLDVHNWLGPDGFAYNSGGGGNCTSIEFYFDDSVAPSGNWPGLPDYYNVYVIVDTAGGPVTSVYQVPGTSPQWTSGASVGIGYKISFGAEGVFLSDPTQTTMYAQVTYICYFQELRYDGYQAK